MARVEASVVLYAADLDDLRTWVGARDLRRMEEAWAVVRDDADADWSPGELEVLHRLLQRVIMQGELYESASGEERYYLTQLLVDLFDEYVDQDALSEDLPLDRVEQVVDALPRGSDAARMAGWLVRGRELNGDGTLWASGPAADTLTYFGYVTRTEAGPFVLALDAAQARARSHPSGLLKTLRAAAEECARAELDLVSFVG